MRRLYKAGGAPRASYAFSYFDIMVKHSRAFLIYNINGSTHLAGQESVNQTVDAVKLKKSELIVYNRDTIREQRKQKNILRPR